MQIKSAALDYRPENKLLMHDAKLQPAHEALLSESHVYLRVGFCICCQPFTFITNSS